MLITLISPALEISAAENENSFCNHVHTEECEENSTHICDDSCSQTTKENSDEIIASDNNASIDSNKLSETNTSDENTSSTSEENTEIVESDEEFSTIEDSNKNSSAETVSGNSIQEIKNSTETTENDSTSSSENENTNIELFSTETPTYLDNIALILGVDNVEINYEDNSITLVNDITINESINITENTILNLNGFSLRGKMESTNDNLFNINSNLVINNDGNIIIEDGDNAISISSSGTLTLNGGNISSINSNRAIFDGGTFIMSGGSICNNHSYANGSAVLVNNGALFNMTSGEISGNTTSITGNNNGGTIVFQRWATGNISGEAVIKNNTSASFGGGIIIKLNSTLNIFGNAKVENNSALRGGGISVSSSTVNVYGNAKVNENIANESGADIYLVESSTCSLAGEVDIGTIFTSDDSSLIDKTSSNSATDLQKLINETDAGGILVLTKDYNKEVPLYIKKDITIDFAGHSITSSTANNVEELISVQNGSTLTLKGNGNILQTASMKCGLIGVEEGCTLNVHDITLKSIDNRCLFAENATINFYSGAIKDSGASSGYVGGGVVLIGATFNMYGGEITNCTSKEGGAIRAVMESTVNIEGGNINNNKSHTNDGGAIYCKDSLLSIKNCTIEENISNKAGGAIACYNTKTDILEGVVINNNESKYNGGGIFIDGTLNVKDATISNNKTIYYGGGIHGNNITISGNTLIKNNEASFGGGVLCGYMYEDQNAKGSLTLTDNVIIEENNAIKLDIADWLIGVGGGVWAHTINIDGNVKIRNNHSDRNAGGIYSRDKIIITSGIIDSNIAEGVGGGIFVFNRGFVQGTPEHKVEIINNEAHDISHHSFAGGGIFVEHPVSGAWQGPDGANLQVNSAIITNNTAAYGGGVGGCGDAVVREFDNIGASIYENIATNDENAKDIYCDGIATITTKALGGSSIEWVGIGKINGESVNIDLKEGSASYEDIRITAKATNEDIETANSIAGVLISGNKSVSGGGGIGGNGAITLGNQITAINVKKVWDDFDDFRKERPESVSISLVKTGMEMQNGGGYVNVNEVIDTVDLNEENDWSYSWTGLSKYDDKNSAYTYKVIENNIPDNYICKIEQNGINVTVTNIHTKVSFTVRKIWDDFEDKDNLRPDSIQIEILRDGEHFDTIELDKDVDWEHFFDGLDRFDKDGVEYDFSLSEIEVPEGYTSITHAIKDGVIIVINKHIPKEIPKISFSIKKIWDDENDKDNIRPENVDVEILRDNEHLETITLSKQNNWEYKLNDLPKTDENDKEYIYSVKELDVPDAYVSNVSKDGINFIITNKYIPKEKIDLNIKKVWEDESNKDNIRPENIDIEILRNDKHFKTITLSNQNNWQDKLLDIDKLDENNNEYIYSIKEINIPTGYTSNVNKNGTEFIITNRHIPKEKINIMIEKVWDDNNNIDNMRPSSIDITLLRNNIYFDKITLSNSNNWQYLFENLDKTDENDNVYTYSIEENKVEGYETSINKTDTSKYKLFTIINKHRKTPEPEKTSIFIKKIWDDSNDIDKIRPDSIFVDIYKNDEKIDTITLSKDNNWGYLYSDLLKKDNNGNNYTYTIKESSKINGYTSYVNGYVITNTHIPKQPEKTSISITKSWDDFNNFDNIRPDNIKVIIYANDIEYKTINLTKDNDWKYKLDDLDKYDKLGNSIEYNIKEVNVNGYDSLVEKTGNDFIITNKHIPKTNILIKKIWDDDNNKFGERPNFIDVNIYRNNIFYQKITLSSNNNWKQKVDNLNVFDENGNKYYYSVEEKNIPNNYQAFIDNKTYTITNKYIEKESPKTNIIIRKIWDDEDDKDNLRPDNIEVDVYRNNIIFKTITLTKDDGWFFELDNLEKEDKYGNVYNYTIKEKDIPNGYTSSINNFTITNKHIPKQKIEKTSITISKIWEDFDNKNNTRPDSIDVEIYQNNILFKTVKITSANKWTLILSDLDKYDKDGYEYVYSIKEINIPDNYVSDINGFSITNTLKETPSEKPEENREPKKKEEQEQIPKAPKTGDKSNAGSYLLLTLLLGMVLIALGLKKEE